MVAHAGAAVGICSAICLGLVGYAIWQAFPCQAGKATRRSVGYGIAASSPGWPGVVALWGLWWIAVER
ncbi:MAG TPA: hypothetical protein VN241_13835 [Microbacterium sp.]|nr:hypothetical protein [Microbacterium sp.]